MPASQHAQYLHPGTGTHKWNETIINVINYTCVFPVMKCQYAVKNVLWANEVNGRSCEFRKTNTVGLNCTLRFFFYPIRHLSTETLFCDCQLKWLLLWAQSNKVRIGNDTVCVFPTHLHGLEFRNLREQQLRCGKDLTA